MLPWAKTSGNDIPQQENPAALKSALIFGAIYALIIFATAAAKDYFGGRALYGIALVSGFVDVDAITLSTARLAAAQRVEVTHYLASDPNCFASESRVQSGGGVDPWVRRSCSCAWRVPSAPRSQAA
ncbi:MAG: DUF4010 domain-containing protein [Gammaproteobacteria bacterium]